MLARRARRLCRAPLTARYCTMPATRLFVAAVTNNCWDGRLGATRPRDPHLCGIPGRAMLQCGCIHPGKPGCNTIVDCRFWIVDCPAGRHRAIRHSDQCGKFNRKWYNCSSLGNPRARERGRPALVASPRASCPRSQPMFTSADVHLSRPCDSRTTPNEHRLGARASCPRRVSAGKVTAPLPSPPPAGGRESGSSPRRGVGGRGAAARHARR